MRAMLRSAPLESNEKSRRTPLAPVEPSLSHVPCWLLKLKTSWIELWPRNEPSAPRVQMLLAPLPAWVR